MTQNAPVESARSGPDIVDGGLAIPSALALIVILSAQLMVMLDFSIVNVALPSIQSDLGFSASGAQWVVTAYAITFGGLLMLGGRAGDVLGRRRVFLAGLIAFSIASLVGGVSRSAGMLVPTGNPPAETSSRIASASLRYVGPERDCHGPSLETNSRRSACAIKSNSSKLALEMVSCFAKICSMWPMNGSIGLRMEVAHGTPEQCESQDS